MDSQRLHADARAPYLLPDTGCLPVVRELVDRLDGAGISYCHWKSNEHLAAAVAGQTDLDVLVSRDNPERLQEVLAAAGYRRFAAVRAFPAIEDYLTHDPKSGQLVHLHLHYELTVGQPHLKGYRLPWERRVLEDRRFEPSFGLYVAAPEIELLLLLTRSALKLRWRDRIRGLVGRPIVAADARREYDWLRERADPEFMGLLADDLIGATAAERLRALLEAAWCDRRFRSFASAARRDLQNCRTFGALGAPLLAWAREVLAIADVLNRRYFHRPVPLRRISPRGGLVVALVGADGSGKSTLTIALRRWLEVKLDVVPIYFGSGDGPSSFYRLPMRLMARRFRSDAREDGSGSRRDARGSFWRRLGKVPWAVALAAEKQGKLRTMVRARNRGMIVVCDRFPQSQVPGSNDGPLLGDWMNAPGRIRRSLALWEANVYDTARRLASPDLVVKLLATPAVAVARKPEMSTSEVSRRIGVIRALHFPSTTLVVEIDADQPIDEVRASIHAAIWKMI